MSDPAKFKEAQTLGPSQTDLVGRQLVLLFNKRASDGAYPRCELVTKIRRQPVCNPHLEADRLRLTPKLLLMETRGWGFKLPGFLRLRKSSHNNRVKVIRGACARIETPPAGKAQPSVSPCASARHADRREP